VPLAQALSCCGEETPTAYYAHFTGMNKPWLEKNANSPDPNVKAWLKELDDLKLPINSQNVHKGSLKSPLGYWHPNKRKL